MTKLIATTFVASLAFASTAHAQSCGDVLVADTTLTADLTCTGPGLTMGADAISLDCAGHTIAGPGSDIGILLDGRTNVTVENCVVTRFSVGILLTDSSANGLRKNSVIASTSVGNGAIQLSNGSDGNVLQHNRTYQNDGRGFAIIDSVGNLLTENAAVGNGFRGVDLIDASGNAVVSNFLVDNLSGGLVLSGSADGNIVFDNDIHDSGSEGVRAYAGTHYFSYNRTDDNGTWGINDSSTSLYLGNLCAGNAWGPSNPFGLCF